MPKKFARNWWRLLKKRSKKLSQPWSVQVELVEGCSRICDFCGINAIRSKPGDFKFMDWETAGRLVQGCSFLCPTARYEFAMHGEPLMHPNRLRMFSLFRKGLPKAQLQVTTNGVRFIRGDMQRLVERIFRHGIDFIILDTYYPERDVLRKKAFKLKNVQVLDFYDDCVPKNISPYHNHRRKLNRTIILMDDLKARDGEHLSRVVLNHAGSSPVKGIPKQPLEKTCTLPFRELSVCYNGNVNICCMDWKHEFVAGNINDSGVKSIWYGERFELARTFLQNKNREFDPCRRCSKNSGPRAGLLPKYGPITPSQRVDIEA